MEPRRDLDKNGIGSSFPRHKVTDPGEIVKDHGLTDIMVHGIFELFQDMNLLVYGEPLV